MNLPKPDQRVMITGLYAGIFSQHVCVVPDATDEEILKECNEHEKRTNSECVWTKVIRTQKDIDDLGLKSADGSNILPGPCQECPPRIHMVVR